MKQRKGETENQKERRTSIALQCCYSVDVKRIIEPENPVTVDEQKKKI